MIDFTALMASMAADGETSSVTATEDWLQGRTIYGGLTAAFCLESVAQHFDELPPLRSAQFSFVGPASGTVMIRPTILRRGKSTVFVGVDLFGEAGLATRATLCYGMARPSSVAYSSLAAPTVPEPETCPPFFRKIPGLNFIQHFEGRFAGGHPPFSQAQHPNFSIWLRHQDAAKPASMSALVALTDARRRGGVHDGSDPQGAEARGDARHGRPDALPTHRARGGRVKVKVRQRPPVEGALASAPPVRALAHGRAAQRAPAPLRGRDRPLGGEQLCKRVEGAAPVRPHFARVSVAGGR